jgi:hypothetical protein
LDGTGEVGLLGAQEQMVVVLHQDIGMDLYPESGPHPAQDLQELAIISLLREDLPLFVSPREDMVEGIGIV